MKRTVKKLTAVILALIFAIAMVTPAFAQDEQTLISSASDEIVFNGAVSPQGIDEHPYLTVTNLTIASDAADPTGIIEVRINNTGSGLYGINWEYRTDSGRVVDPPQVYDKGNGSNYRWFKLKVTAVQGGQTTIPIYAYYNTEDNIIATANCTITVTAPTLTVTPYDIVIDLNRSNSTTVNAVISNYTSSTLDIGYAVSSNNISASYGNYIYDGTEIIVTGNTPGTYYLYTYIRNPYSGYNIVQQSHRVTVKAKTTLSSVAINSKPYKTTYTVGDTFDSSGLSLTAYYSDGTTKTITSGFTCSSPDMSTAGTKKVTVTYEGKSTSFNIVVNAKQSVTLSSISIRTNPSKTTYVVGESFNSSGLTLNAYYSDGTSKTITSGFTCSKPDMSTAGTKKVTVTYQGKTTSFNITVKAASVKATSVDIVVDQNFGDGNVAELSASVNPSNASYKSITWSSSDTSIATVDADGTVTTHGNAGKATITVTVTNHDGTTVSDSVEVTVEGGNDSGGGIFDLIINFFMMILELLLLPFTLLF